MRTERDGSHGGDMNRRPGNDAGMQTLGIGRRGAIEGDLIAPAMHALHVDAVVRAAQRTPEIFPDANSAWLLVRVEHADGAHPDHRARSNFVTQSEKAPNIPHHLFVFETDARLLVALLVDSIYRQHDFVDAGLEKRPGVLLVQ